MVRTEFSFRGKSLKELSEMTIDQFAALVNSRARRSLKRGYPKQLLKKMEKARKMISAGKEPRPIRTHWRDSIVIPAMVGLRFAVHRGNSFETIEIKPLMLGHYLGELVLTRKKLQHGKAGIGATKSSTAIASARV